VGAVALLHWLGRKVENGEPGFEPQVVTGRAV